LLRHPSQNFSLDNVLDAASNELDWPQCSWSTGFRNTSACPASPIPMGSIYQRMRERNLCMHRDYTNFGVNGARVSSAASELIPNLKRDQQNDAPVIAFYALIGNDVCNGHPGLTRMTTPAEFHISVLQSLQEFNNTLPAGSHVAVLGLVDGLILYDTMHNQTHPLGIDYTSVYGALTCNGANPCNGWLTANDTLRQLTQQRANNLTAVYDQIISETNGTWTFDIYRLDLDWIALFQKYVKEYGDARGAIEPVDGFHPSQATHQLLAQIIWQNLEANRPAWLPPVNPNNAKIQELFGDQGGY
jgi:acyloxyacyl hydrolase